MSPKVYLLLATNIALSASEQPTPQSFYQKLPNVTLERIFYTSATVGAFYCGYRILSNEVFKDNVAALYNLACYGHVVSPAEKLAKTKRRTEKAKQISTIQDAQAIHTAQLHKITADLASIQELSRSLVTKADLQKVQNSLGAIKEQLDRIENNTALLEAAREHFQRQKRLRITP